MSIWKASEETDSQIETLFLSKLRQAKIVHEISFYVGLVFTTLFYWNLGGDSIYWSMLFAALGFVIDFTKKSELEISAFTTEKVSRWRKRTLALILTGVSLLGSLGASLTRASAVTSAESVAVDTAAIDARIALAQQNIALWQNILKNYPYDYVRARDAAAQKIDQYSQDLETAQAELSVKQQANAGVERRSDMFSLLARFFNIKDYETFMVVLLMIGAAGIDLSFWVTMPPYWKRRANLPKPAPQEIKTPAPRVVEADTPQKSPGPKTTKQASLF